MTQRQICACGTELRHYRGVAGYEAMVCDKCNEHWNDGSEEDFKLHMRRYVAGFRNSDRSTMEAAPDWVELKELREVYGGGDGLAINRHSTRVYHWERVGFFVLDRTLDGVPNFYQLTWLEHDPRKKCERTYFPKWVDCGGGQYWGGGLSWRAAIDRARKAVRLHLPVARPAEG